jgi:hypothetical protein
MQTKELTSGAAWFVARLVWECNPAVSLGQVAELLGVAEERVLKEWFEDGWRKVRFAVVNGPTLACLAAACGRVVMDGAEAARVDARLRVGVLYRHRADCEALRSSIWQAANGGTLEEAAATRQAAHGLVMLHDMERSNFGITAEDAAHA